MAPIRRYLRITKYSVLECRIYLDNPALAQTWLLNPRDPVLPRVIASIQPLVLPKLREERERARKKGGGKKKGIKDTIVEDDFEVSMFLTETSTRHSILKKHKHFRDKLPRKLQSNSSKLLGDTSDEPIDVENAAASPVILREEDEEEASLADIPSLGDIQTATRQSKRQRTDVEDSDGDFDPIDIEDEDEDLNPDSESAPPPKRARQNTLTEEDDDDQEDKKKMAVDISYEGFAIYGLVLCLVVKKRGPAVPSGRGRAAGGAASASGGGEKLSGHAMMENWISSTQVPAGMEEEG